MMAAECDVQSEIEVLESIYLDELQADRTTDGGWEVSLVLHPSTAEDAVSQFVRLTLTLTLDQQYPSSPPAISIRNPRGLSDDQLCSVHRSLQLEARNSLGSPVLYQLIEKAKEILTESNIPHGNCVICLYGFKEGEAFTKTGCYHYFHSHCLGRYVSHSEAELRRREAELQEDKTREGARPQDLSVVCPVCREPLDYDLQQLLSSAAPQLPELDRDALGSDFQQKWAELQELLDRQRARGGVIDPEQESTRFLIRIQETPAAEPGQQEGAAPPGAPPPEDATAPPAPPTGPRRLPPPPRGPRRARRGGAGPVGGAGPLPERLQKLTLPSDCSPPPPPPSYHGNGPLGSRGPGEAFEDPSGLEDPKEAEPAGGRGHRGRRRGSHYAGASRPLPRRRWDGHAPRGGGAHRGHAHRGRHGNGLQPQAAERGREEVL